MKSVIKHHTIMSATSILGYVASTMSAIATLPQLFSIVRSMTRKDTARIKGVSTSTFVFLSLSQALWIVYGALVADVPVILASSVSCVTTTLITTIKLVYMARVRTKDDSDTQYLVQSTPSSSQTC